MKQAQQQGQAGTRQRTSGARRPSATSRRESRTVYYSVYEMQCIIWCEVRKEADDELWLVRFPPEVRARSPALRSRYVCWSGEHIFIYRRLFSEKGESPGTTTSWLMVAPPPRTTRADRRVPWRQISRRPMDVTAVAQFIAPPGCIKGTRVRSAHFTPQQDTSRKVALVRVSRSSPTEFPLAPPAHSCSTRART